MRSDVVQRHGATRVEVDDGGQVQPTFVGPQVVYIADRFLVGLAAVKSCLRKLGAAGNA
jgi:hypothetical protein